MTREKSSLRNRPASLVKLGGPWRAPEGKWNIAVGIKTCNELFFNHKFFWEKCKFEPDVVNNFESGPNFRYAKKKKKKPRKNYIKKLQLPISQSRHFASLSLRLEGREKGNLKGAPVSLTEFTVRANKWQFRKVFLFRSFCKIRGSGWKAGAGQTGWETERNFWWIIKTRSPR